jgi:uncharacterized protein YjbJ (UPF0337 family)
MVNQQVLAGHWNEVSGKLKQKWGKLSDDELRSFSGNVDQLVGAIQRKTGESRAAIEEFLGELADETATAASHVGQRVREGAAAVSESAQQGYEALCRGYDEAERTIQARPAQSMAIAFGLGVACGLGLALMFRERRSESTVERGRATAEHLGRQLRDVLGSMMPHKA